MPRAFTLEKNRGRLERRTLTTSTRDGEWSGWLGLRQFLRLERTTTVHGETTTTVQYAITSLPPDRASPEMLLDLWRGRWEIENRLFWVRDVTFGEDHSRIRQGTAPHAMSLLKNAAINTLRALKASNFAAALRENALNVTHLFRKLGITTSAARGYL